MHLIFLVQYIEEASGRTERHKQAGCRRHTGCRRQTGRDIISSIPYVNGGTLLFSASSNKYKNNVKVIPMITYVAKFGVVKAL